MHLQKYLIADKEVQGVLASADKEAQGLLAYFIRTNA